MPLTGWAQTAASQGYGTAADILLDLPGIGLDEAIVPPTPDVSGQGSASYGPFQDSVTGPDMDIMGSVVFSTGTLSAETAYDAVARQVYAEGSADDAMSMVVLPSQPDFMFTADNISSRTEISGTCDDLQISASTTITNGQLDVDDENIGMAENPPPNSVIDLGGIGFAGVTVILNEQIISGDGLHDLSVTTNAVHIIFTVDTMLAELTGEIIIGASSASITGCTSADVSISQTATPDPATAGESLTYTLTVSNAGPDAASSLAITDALPGGLMIDSLSADPAASCSLAGQQLNCSIASLNAGASADVVIVGTPIAAGTLVNTAVLTQATDDPDPSNNSSTISTQVNPAPPQGADLGMSMMASSNSVTVGDPLSYTIQVSNAGPLASGSFIIEDTVPDNLTVDSFIASFGLNCTRGVSQQVTCTGSSLGMGESVSVVINTTAVASGTATNTAIVSQSDPDPDPSNNQASITTQVEPAPQPQADLQVQFSPPPPSSVNRGELHDLFIVMTNDGPETAEQVFLQVDIPMSGNAEQVITDADLQCNVTEFQVTCETPAMASSVRADVRIIVELDIPGEDQVFSAQVSAATADPDLSNNQESHSVDVLETR